MNRLQHTSKFGYLGSAFLIAFSFGLSYLPVVANAATAHMTQQHRDAVTEAVFVGIGLLLCLFGLFEMDLYRARHPRQIKHTEVSDSDLTPSASTQH
ncbi:hypothetical protein [Secundilactobacillus folii]|uniref:Uncharacterized protein n=1 Tax=Secundilactobacillus folii TaxID=2678357 RepID=A0A7X3C1E7_9LACO|nr:hypothetical protein [Secundilactobacillus folii]MTV81645.1 hypothetical protein [Secundilactobacillus folii]